MTSLEDGARLGFGFGFITVKAGGKQPMKAKNSACSFFMSVAADGLWTNY